MTPDLDDVLKTIGDREHQSAAALAEFLSIPSVSAKSEHRPDMRRAAAWLKDQLAFAELEASVMETPGHPIVVAKNRHEPGRPAVLFYGHYDVQPPEPLHLWETPPFEPATRNGAIHARGASDDKGQVWAHLAAIQAWQAHGGVPVNLTVLIEGEEEVASENLGHFLKEYADHLRADVAVVSDTGMLGRGRPAITYGLRGLLYAEVTLTAAITDLHSGLFGGAVPNPANVLCRLLGELVDLRGRVTLPGFYDDVIEPGDEERRMWADLGSDDADLKEQLGLAHLSGEEGYTTRERLWARPTCDVNGLTGGYQGEGAKTVLPGTASGKVSFRLVPGQDPHAIKQSFVRTLGEKCPTNVKIDFKFFGAEPAALVPHDSPAAKLAAEAVEIGFGTRPAFIRGGGSIPVVGLLKERLGLDTLLVGFGLPDDNLHAPNEKFDLASLHHGTRTAAALYDKLASLKSA